MQTSVLVEMLTDMCVIYALFIYNRDSRQAPQGTQHWKYFSFA